MIGEVRESAPMSRQDLHRREGARGEIATVEERLARINTILSRRQRVLHWNSVQWHIEQLRRQIKLMEERRPTASTRAMSDTVEGLDRLLADLDDVLTELRAETAGAVSHIHDAAAALRIDLYLADKYRLHAAGLDEAQLDSALNGERLLETAS